MKKIILCFLTLMLALPSFARKIKISVDQEDAKIYVDGALFGEGVVVAEIKKGDFIMLKIEKPGYVTIKTRVNEAAKQKAVSFTMHEDEFWINSIPSGNANKFFTITISDDYINYAGDEKKAAELVWKQLHQILLSYFDEIEKSDMLGGYIQTNWVYESYPQSDKQVRTRVSIQQSNIIGELSYKIKVSSEEASFSSSHSDDNFQNTPRLLKKYEPMISEFQSRLGKR